MSINIADLPVVDDLDVPYDPEAYVDQATGPALAKPGNYRFQVTKHKVQTKKDGTLLLIDDKYPVVVIEQVKIVEPVDQERLVGVFTDVRFKPYQRKASNGALTVASDVHDLLRAFDATVTFEGSAHMRQLLQQYFEQNATFLGQLGLVGYDAEYVKAQKAQFTPETPKDISNAMYAKAKFSTKNFTVNGDYVSEISSPTSGNTIVARARVTRYFPSTIEIVEGPKAGKGQIVLGPFTPRN
jgi:hypothetical protein